jgi:hypothetical protein
MSSPLATHAHWNKVPKKIDAAVTDTVLFGVGVGAGFQHEYGELDVVLFHC